MGQRHILYRAERGMERLAATLSRVAAAVLVLLVLLTIADVGLRYLLALPIRGAHEVTQVMMLAIVMLSLAFCETQGGHIRVDLLDNVLGRRVRRLVDALTALLAAAALLAMGHRAVLRALDAREYGDASSFLELPLWPHYGVIAFGVITYALAILLRAASGSTTSGGTAHD